MRDRPEEGSSDAEDRQILADRVRRQAEDQLFQPLKVQRIGLAYEARPDLITRPRDRAPEQLSAKGIAPTAADLFDWADDSLLILGGPGAGKSTLIAKLADHLLSQVESGKIERIPVITNLSSWTSRSSSIAEWLVGELVDRYEIPQQLASRWVGDNQLIPLFDGLDEVSEARRTACVEAINVFRSNHRALRLAVSCRLADYEALGMKLDLRGAAVIKPLSRQQIEEYFAEIGTSLADVESAFGNENAGLLRELLQSPLILGIVALTYTETPDALLAEAEPRTFVDARERLLSVYIDAMFERQRAYAGRARRTTQIIYAQQEAVRWLSWLAQQMRENYQHQFRLDRLQLNWLSTASRRRAARMIAWTIEAFTYVLIGSATAAVVRIPVTNYLAYILWWCIGGLLGLVFFVPFHFRHEMRYALRHGGAGTVLGRIRAAVGQILRSHAYDEADTDWVAPVESISLSWLKLWRAFAAGLASFGWNRLRSFLPWGPVWILLGAIVSLLFNVWFADSAVNLRTFLSNCLFVVLLFAWLDGIQILISALIFAYQEGMSIRVKPSSMTPNEGIRRSARNAAVVGLGAGLLAASLAALLALSLMIARDVSMSSTGRTAAWIVAIVALASAMFAGGRACIRHFTLRSMLLMERHVPVRYVNFLNFASDRILLRRMGGAYEFIHPLLLNHFANLRASDGVLASAELQDS